MWSHSLKNLSKVMLIGIVLILLQSTKLFAYTNSLAENGQLPIHIVYVNHVEVESVIDYTPPAVDGTTYLTTTERYNYTKSQLEWETALAESVGAYISFHMSGAYAERAFFEMDSNLWGMHLVYGHTVGCHAHPFMRGANSFEWVYNSQANQTQIEQHWQDNHDLVGALVGTEQLWIGESHYSCLSCWNNLGYSLKSTEAMALLPAGNHIVWLVERGPDSIITYPHFPQIGQAGWHGPFDNRIYFDLRLPQLKKEFLMLYLEWLERERLGLEPQIWAWGWANHGGSSTELYAAEIQEILSWLNENFIDSLSPRGNIIAQFASDHELKGIYENYESSGGQPLPSPLDSINDQFPYMDTALTDCGVTTDLSSSLGLSGIRLFEMEINPPEDPQPEPLSKVYLLFRETDGIDTIDISAVLALQDISDTTMILTDVKTFATSQVSSTNLILGPTPLVLTPAVQQVSSEDSPFGFHPAIVTLPGYPDNGFIDALNIGIKWARQGVYAFWFIVQPDINNPVYDFSLYDQQWSAIPDEINILANISPQGHLDEGYCLPGTWIPIDSTKYCDFVKATVERYDGDSLSDMPGLTNPIKYWQVGNEPNENITSDFATLQRMTYIAIKEACPDCRVLIGGVAGFPLGYVQSFDSDYMPILTELAGQYVDIMDIHWYGTATGEYREVEVAYNHIRDTMNTLGFSPDLPFWITEMGAYSGDPANAGPLVFPYQSEQQQGADYLKRHVHSLSIGVGKIFCAFGLSEGFKLDNGYFDHTGLIYDGLGSNDLGLGKKKLGYFSYKKMTTILEGCDWDSTQSISTGVENVYAYRFVRNDSSIYAAWWDYFDDPNYITGDSIQLTLTNLNWDSALVTEAIPYDTFENAFNVNTVEIISGSITVTLKENPLFIEASSTGESCCVGIRGNIDGDPYDEINIADLVFLVDFMFNYGNPPPCPEEADVNGDNEQDIADLVYLVDYSFSNPPGPQPVDCL